MESRSEIIEKVAVFTGSRAEYGILKPVMGAINKHDKLRLFTVVCGMHLSAEFGNTSEEIEKDGFEINSRIASINTVDSCQAMAHYLGDVIVDTSDVLSELSPDAVVVLGDRVDILGVVMAAAYMNIPIAHIHGGDVSNAGLDEPARHAITKFAHIHFPATERSAERLIKMGEEPERVHVVGAPGLDTILGKKLPDAEELSERYSLDMSKPVVLVLQHSVTTEPRDAEFQMSETMAAIAETDHQTIVIYPNADAGGRKMIEVIKRYVGTNVKAYRSLPHEDYLGLMKIASVMVGNSSSGVIESSSFNLPVVNIGTRQKGRERSDNVINAEHDRSLIVSAMKRAIYDDQFLSQVSRCQSPYGQGRAGVQIADILTKISINRAFLQKRVTY